MSAAAAPGFTPQPLDPGAAVYVAGHRGLVGSAIWRELDRRGFTNLHGLPSSELDLLDRSAVFAYIRSVRPEVVVLAAAKVGGIQANNTHPVDFLSENVRIQVNVLDAALEQRVPRLVFLGSSCIYPKFAEQPIREDSLLTGKLEPTNDAYAIAKIAGITQVQAVRRQYSLPWVSVMPTNLYGPGDNFSATDSHVLPAMIRRFVEAQDRRDEVVMNWGTGRVRREFLHVDDMARAAICVLERFDGPTQVNIGTGEDITIRELSDVVAREVGYTGEVRWDTTRPDGTPRKLLDVSTVFGLGWRPKVPLSEGIRDCVAWFRENRAVLRD